MHAISKHQSHFSLIFAHKLILTHCSHGTLRQVAFSHTPPTPVRRQYRFLSGHAPIRVTTGDFPRRVSQHAVWLDAHMVEDVNQGHLQGNQQIALQG